MPSSPFRRFLAWYTYGGPNEVRSFDSRDEALAWQQDPKGLPWLGDKWIVEVVYTSPYRASVQVGLPATAEQRSLFDVADLLNAIWRVTVPETFPGPETADEANARMRRARVMDGVESIVRSKSKETKKKNRDLLLAEQPELTEAEVLAMEAELEGLKASRKRGPRTAPADKTTEKLS